MYNSAKSSYNIRFWLFRAGLVRIGIPVSVLGRYVEKSSLLVRYIGFGLLSISFHGVICDSGYLCCGRWVIGELA